MAESGIISKILFVIYLIIAIYLVNISLSFIILPEIITNLDNWIILIAGVLVLLGGINHLRLRRVKY